MEETINKILEIDNKAKATITQIKLKEENIENYISKRLQIEKEKVDNRFAFKKKNIQEKYDAQFEQSKQKLDERKSIKIKELQNKYSTEKDILLNTILNDIIRL